MSKKKLSRYKVTQVGSLHPEVLKEVPDPEVTARPRRRRFTKKYKIEVIRKLDQMKCKHERGEFLRREGLYFSNITLWRSQLENGIINVSESKVEVDMTVTEKDLHKQVKKLQSENEKLKSDLHKARTIIDFQKKMANLLDELEDEKKK